MRRDVLIAAAESLLKAFEESGVSAVFETGVNAFETGRDRAQTASGPKIAMDVFRRFTTLSRGFGDVERRLMTIFDLEDFDSTEFWFEAVSNGLESPVLRRYAWHLETFKSFIPKVIELLATDATEAKRQHDPDGVLTAILIEEKGQASKPERIVEAIESIMRLYTVFTTLRALPADSLAVIGCDSGSDKSFDFLGVADAIKAVKELIIELWDRTVFYRQTRTEQNINVAVKSLGVVDEIARMESQGALQPEDAERLRRAAVAAATQFLNCGILIPEIQAHASFNPRRLMVPQPKLLTGAIGEVAAASVPTVEDEPPMHKGLTPEEESMLRLLLEKARAPSDSEPDGTL